MSILTMNITSKSNIGALFLKAHAQFIRYQNVPVRCLRLTACGCRYFPSPSPREEAALSKRYPKPIRTVFTFMEPMVRIKPEHQVKLSVTPSRYIKPHGPWKVTLTFTWPLLFKVSASNKKVPVAVEGAFLKSCRLLYDLGLLTKKGELVPFFEHLMDAKRKAVDKLPCGLLEKQSRFELLADNSRLWHAKICVRWPFTMVCKGVGQTREDALRNAAVHVFIKLKAENFLDNNNTIKESSKTFLPIINGERFVPDYEVYVDSSINAYGAYLRACPVEGDETAELVWISAPWPDDIRAQFVKPRADSTLLEFCGILAAITTWKEKFAGKSVLVYNDNISSISILNGGLALRKSVYRKVFAVIRTICMEHKITLKSEHIHRTLNRPADCLSKFRVADFRQLIPNAKTNGEKSTNLFFNATNRPTQH